MARKSRKETAYHIGETVLQPIPETLYKAALYGRISVETKEKLDRDTMGTQMELLREYAATIPELSVYNEYIDDDVTGTSFDRPAFERMMRDIEQGRVNCVIVKDLSRFARNHISAGEYLGRVFPKLGVRFIAITDGIDTLRDDGGIIVPFKNVINEQYARESSVKLTQNFKTMQRLGQFCSSKPPYGYVRSCIDKHQFIVDEEAAVVVRKIFMWYTSGVTKHEICKRLEAQGIPCPMRYAIEKGHINSTGDKHGRLQWNPEQITKIVSMRQYCGDMVQNRMQSTFLQTGKKGSYKMNAKEDWIVVEDAHAAIVSQELYEKAQEVTRMNALLKKQQREKNSHIVNPEYCLSGVLRCAHCGGSINVKRRIKNGVPTYWYICPVHDKFGNVRCVKKNMKFKETNDLVYEILKKHMKNFLAAQDYLQYCLRTDELETERVRLNQELKQLNSSVMQVQNVKGKLYHDLKSGLIEDDDYVFLSTKYRKELEELGRQIEAIGDKLSAIERTMPKPGNALVKIQEFRRDETLTKAMAEAFIESIVVDNDGRFEVSLKTRDEFEEIIKRIEMQEGVMTNAG